MESRWRDPGWLSTAHAWIEGELARLGLGRVGDMVQPHVYPSSTVLRVPTVIGDVWFKANVDELRHEAALVELLADRRPDCVPPLIAADFDRGWMLMADAGEPLRAVVAAEHHFDRWLDVLPLYAGLQVDLASDVEELLAIGVPDLRLTELPQRYEQLLDEIHAEPALRASARQVAEYCDELAAYGIAETIQHDDLHDGQVFLREGRYLLLDWAEACIAHPFFTLSVTLEGGLAWGPDDIQGSLEIAPFRDAYLAAYSARPDEHLIGAYAVAARLGWVCRAINGHVTGGASQTLVRLRMFLHGHP